MTDVSKEIHNAIKARLKELKPLVEEYEKLVSADNVLASVDKKTKKKGKKKR